MVPESRSFIQTLLPFAVLIHFSVVRFLFSGLHTPQVFVAKLHRDTCLGLDPFWGKHVQVSAFVGTVFEVFCLDQTFINQRLHAVVCFAQTDPQLRCQFALGYAWIIL
jgi:GH43 family beta-xylosidase